MSIVDGLPIVDATATGLLCLVFLAVLTDRLVWHTRLKAVVADRETRLKEAREERDRWQKVALDALGVADKMTTQGEVTTAIVASLPDPALSERDQR